MKPRILAIDDEATWIDNFKAWIPEEMAIQDSADTTSKALELLRRYRYHVILLDLSMDTHNPFNRENHAIQEYLATRPEGTLYIIVSGTAEKVEVRDAAFRLGAWDVVFKPEIDPGVLRDKVTRATEEASKKDSQFIIEAKRKLIINQVHESEILKVLDPKEGAGGMYAVLDMLFHRIAPIAIHNDRPTVVIKNNCVLGLVWSRLVGTAVSFALANRRIPEAEVTNQLTDWLGYAQRNSPICDRESHRVRIQIFEEPNVQEVHFDLPDIIPTGD